MSAVRPMMKDWFLVSTLAGMIGSLAKDVLRSLFVRLGVLKFTYWHLAAMFFLPPSDVNTGAGWFTGIASDLALGGIHGVAIYGVLHFSGFELWHYKGLTSGIVSWFLLPGLLLKAFADAEVFDPAFRVISFIDHGLFGLTAAYLIRRWHRPGRGRALEPGGA